MPKQTGSVTVAADGCNKAVIKAGPLVDAFRIEARLVDQSCPQCRAPGSSQMYRLLYFSVILQAKIIRNETVFRSVIFGFTIKSFMDVIGLQPIPVVKNRFYRWVRRAVPLPVLQTRGGSGPAWRLRTAAQPAGGEHHRHVQAGLHQVRDEGLHQVRDNGLPGER